MRIRHATLGALLLTIPFKVFGAGTFDPTIYSKGAELIESFSGPGGWTGHLVKVHGVASTAKIVMWEDDTGVVTFGKLYDRTGRDLNMLATDRYNANAIGVQIQASLGDGIDGVKDIPITEEGAEKRVYAALQSLDQTFYSGQTSADAVYVFYDYNCSPCAQTHKSLRARADIDVKWLPVSILYDSSLTLGAGVLDGTVDLTNIGKTSISEPVSPSPESVARVWHNTALLESLKTEAVVTPTILFKDARGDVKVKTGHLDENELREIVASR